MEAAILDTQHLLQLAQDKTEQGRYALAEAVSGFFDTRSLNDSEERLAAEVLMRLIRQAEYDLREALAVKLSVYDNIPAPLALFLANDDISVARHVLEHSPVLKDADLVSIIAQHDAGHWRSIAARKKISPLVADRLIDTGDINTARTLIDNPHISLRPQSVRKLVKTSLNAEELQPSLLRRPEMDANLATDLYMCVGHALRQEILSRFPISAETIEASMDDLVEELSLEAHGQASVTPEMTTLAKRLSERNNITPDLLVKTLRKGQGSFFTALFAEKSGLRPREVVDIIRHEDSRHFATACRAIRMLKSEFASLFLLSRVVRGGDRTINQKELIAALNHYDTIRTPEAERTIKNWTMKA